MANRRDWLIGCIVAVAGRRVRVNGERIVRVSSGIAEIWTGHGTRGNVERLGDGALTIAYTEEMDRLDQ